MRLLTKIVTALVVAVSALSVAPAAQANNIGNNGCTPGYWKNHVENWQEVTPSTKVSVIYTKANAAVANLTLDQALAGGGGAGLDGASKILARAAVAAWLNAAHEGVGYPWRRYSEGLDGRPALVPTVNAAFLSGNRATILDLATRLDNDNNLGCTLN